ncbi:methyltransferase [Pannonibacter sp. Pt2-lr]
MISGFGWAALALLFGYLALFFWGSALAARRRPAGLALRPRHRARPSGRHRVPRGLCARLLRATSLARRAYPAQDRSALDRGARLLLGLVGVFVAGLGAMVAFAAQMSMGSSWRVGVVGGETGDLVSGGLYRFSRNPTFVGQAALLAGVAMAVPAIPTVMASLLFLWSASTQVRSEEAALRMAIGPDYDQYTASVPRWIGMKGKTVQ